MYICKRYWRPYFPDTVPSNKSSSFYPEGRLYKLSGERIASRVVSSDDLRIGNTLDSTFEHIRGGIIGSQPKEDETVPEPHSEHDADKYANYEGGLAHGEVGRQQLQSRIHHYILMGGTGHSIKHFKDIAELVRVARDAMQGKWFPKWFLVISSLMLELFRL